MCLTAKVFEYTSSGIKLLEKMKSISDMDSGAPSTVIIVSNSTLKDSSTSGKAKLIM